MAKNNTISYRVGVLEKRVDSMDKKIDNILQNHLPAIEKEIIALRTRVNVSVGVNIIQVIALIIGIAILLR